jgi:hypothetical protein
VAVEVVWDSAALRAWAEHGIEPKAAMDRLAAVAVNLMKAHIPVSKVQPVYASGGATVSGGVRYGGDFPLRPSGFLRNSTRAYRQEDGSVLVGPAAPYAGYVNDGTPAHDINSTGTWPLRNRATGQVFGPHVHHPGTTGAHFTQQTAADLDGLVIRG